jgi:Mrp family chromosome partitioning ATPase
VVSDLRILRLDDDGGCETPNTLSASKALEPADKKGSYNLTSQTQREIVNLMQRLFVSVGTTAPKVVMFAGVEHGSGCSWVCHRIVARLTTNLASSVCLVDANFHSPSFRKNLEVEEAQDVTSVEWVLKPAHPDAYPRRKTNLCMLSFKPPTGGRWQTQAGIDRFQSQLSDLGTQFDYVLIDAPPLNSFAEAALLGRMTDGVVMVLHANKTRRDAALKAKTVLEAAGVRILGAVLNKRKFPIPEFLYRRL